MCSLDSIAAFACVLYIRSTFKPLMSSMRHLLHAKHEVPWQEGKPMTCAKQCAAAVLVDACTLTFLVGERAPCSAFCRWWCVWDI